MTVKDYLEADRQWPHHLRVAHAEMQLKQSQSMADQKFWSAILEANNKKLR